MTCLSPSRLLNYQARAWLYASLSRCVLEGWIVRASCQSPLSSVAEIVVVEREVERSGVSPRLIRKSRVVFAPGNAK